MWCAHISARNEQRKHQMKTTKTTTKTKATKAPAKGGPLAARRKPEHHEVLHPETKATPEASPAKTARKGAPAKKETATKTTAAAKASKPRAEGKGATILQMITGADGATLPEIMKATGWQAHSVRGFISIAKKNGTKIASDRNAAGERVYSAKGAK
jgi:hypothetical protein